MCGGKDRVNDWQVISGIMILIDSRDDAGWAGTRISGPQPLPLPALGIELTMAEICEGIGLIATS
jgi:hypothetical protein